MDKKFSYKLRPGYGSNELLIEFFKTGDTNIFISNLLSILKTNNFKIDGIQDFWQNDEALIDLTSANGKIIISKDIWDMVFIMAEDNQNDILKIDNILLESGLFQKLKTDPKDYTL